MNLLRDPWMPILRQDGRREYIVPHQLTEDYTTNPIVALDAPRPDFNGALVQFLIGLLQTTFPVPDHGKEWRSLRTAPPSPETLRATFEPFVHAFELDGEGPRFMQDRDALETVEPESISQLLIDIPGHQAIRQNTDHFVKRGLVTHCCWRCGVQALLTLQINAPSGGAGHRTGLRGGGPLTTLLLGDNLWETIWHNVLLKDSLGKETGNPECVAESKLFPWLDATVTSEKGSTPIQWVSHPPEHVFWGMPRRIRLSMEQAAEPVTCHLCDDVCQTIIKQYRTRNYGMNYDSAWRHPLTPYTKKEEGIQLPVHPGLDGITYRHWLGLVFQDPDTARTPALVIREFYTRKLPRHQGLRIWAFGYDMDNMKARSWHESVMPLVLVDDEIREAFTAGVSCLVRASRESAAIIREAIKKVWFKPGATARGDLSLPDQRFWQDTEPDFFAALETLARQLSAGEDGETVRKAWQGTLKRSCERLFHELANTRMIEQQDPKRIALSWQMMQKRLHGPKLRGMLSI